MSKKIEYKNSKEMKEDRDYLRRNHDNIISDAIDEMDMKPVLDRLAADYMYDYIQKKLSRRKALETGEIKVNQQTKIEAIVFPDCPNLTIDVKLSSLDLLREICERTPNIYNMVWEEFQKRKEDEKKERK